jgi:hypothetical protein
MVDLSIQAIGRRAFDPGQLTDQAGSRAQLGQSDGLEVR